MNHQPIEILKSLGSISEYAQPDKEEESSDKLAKAITMLQEEFIQIESKTEQFDYALEVIEKILKLSSTRSVQCESSYRIKCENTDMFGIILEWITFIKIQIKISNN